VLPEEAQLLKEINELRPRLELAREEPERERLKRAVVELTLKYNLLVERYRGKRRSD
jgi:hypothetical protein